MSTSPSIASSPERLNATAVALVRRSRPGVFAYVGLASVVALSAGSQLSIGARAGFVAVTVVLGALRLWIAAAQGAMCRTRPEAWLTRFRLGTLASGSYWGLCTGLWLLQTRDTESLVVLLTTAGIVAGGVPTLAPDLKLTRLYTPLLLLPSFAGVLVAHGAVAWGSATVILLYLGYMQLQSTQQHREFHEAIDKTELLSLRAKALEDERARAERALVAADAANRAKSAFLANMSHELRTPLTAIIGYSEILQSSDGDVDRIEHAEIIHRNGNNLLHILNDILDLSKIEAERLTVVSVPFSLTQLLHDVESLMRVRATERGLVLGVILRTQVPSKITADVMRVRQILLNLVSNAIKFTEHGSVSIVASLALLPEPRITISIEDTGIGLSEEAQNKLFQAFSQADESSSRAFGGTGLGLHISRCLARLMHGDVHMHSAPGIGSSFSLELPVHPSDLDDLSEPVGVEVPEQRACR